MTSTRTKARKAALDALYAADLRGVDPAGLLESDAREYTVAIVNGVADRGAEIDELITTYARDWPIDRMPVIDRALLRIGTWEILANPAVPRPVAISEAVDLAAELSTDDSARFVNGVLGRIADSL